MWWLSDEMFYYNINSNNEMKTIYLFTVLFLNPEKRSMSHKTLAQFTVCCMSVYYKIS